MHKKRAGDRGAIRGKITAGQVWNETKMEINSPKQVCGEDFFQKNAIFHHLQGNFFSSNP